MILLKLLVGNRSRMVNEEVPFGWRQDRAARLQPLPEQLIRIMLTSEQQIA